MKIKLKHNYIIFILSVLINLPYLSVVFFALPRNDEFASAQTVKSLGGYSLLSIFKSVIRMYNNWEGNYSGHFFWAALNPILIGNTDSTVKLFNIIGFLLFAVCWSYVIYNVLSLFKIESKYRFALSQFIFIISLNCRFLRELLAWFTGMSYYTLTLLIGSLGTIFLAKNIEKTDILDKKSIHTLIIVSICCVISVGGVLQIAALFCWVYILFFIYMLLNHKRIIKVVIPLLITLFSTFINLASPGYYIRKNDYQSVSILKGLFYGAICVVREIKRLCAETYIPYALILLFLLLLFTINTKKYQIYYNPLLIGFILLIILITSTAPVCYGYGSPQLASRGYEILDLMIILFSTIFLSSLVIWLNHHAIRLSSKDILIIIISVVFFFTSYSVNNISISDIPTFKCMISICDGSVIDYSNYWRNIIHQVEDNANSNKELIIPVEKKYFEQECLIDRFMIQEDSNNWVNLAVAYYYGYESVKIEIIESSP